MSKGILTIRVPTELNDRIETLVAQQGVSNDHVADRDVPDWDRPDITTGDIG